MTIFIAVLFLLASPALAQALDANGNVCPVGTGLINRIVVCIRFTVAMGVAGFLMPFSIAIAHLVGTVCLLAVIFYGFNVLFIRQRRMQAEAFILAIKLGAVMIFTWNFRGLFPILLAIIDWMVNLAGSYVTYSIPLSCPFAFSMWERVDCVLDRIIGGLTPATALTTGILGFLFGCIFSGPTGFSIFLVGLALIATILMAIFKAVYIYLSSFIALSLLVIISPLIIPLILFKVTKAYFEKWLRLMIGMMLQPIFLFVYLSMLLAAFDVVVFSGPKSLYATIAGAPSANPGFSIGGYMISTGAYVERSKLPTGINLNAREMAEGLGLHGLEQTGMAGQVGKWAQGLNRKYETMIDKNIGADVPVQAVDFRQLASVLKGGPVTNGELTLYIIRVTMSLLMAVIVAYIFYIMLQFVPYLGTQLTGEILSTPQLGKGIFDKGMGQFKDQLSGGKPAAFEPPKDAKPGGAGGLPGPGGMPGQPRPPAGGG